MLQAPFFALQIAYSGPRARSKFSPQTPILRTLWDSVPPFAAQVCHKAAGMVRGRDFRAARRAPADAVRVDHASTTR
jgi:hypothetical protein